MQNALIDAIKTMRLAGSFETQVFLGGAKIAILSTAPKRIAITFSATSGAVFQVSTLPNGDVNEGGLCINSSAPVTIHLLTHGPIVQMGWIGKSVSGDHYLTMIETYLDEDNCPCQRF